jgi:hypothetical protein
MKNRETILNEVSQSLEWKDFSDVLNNGQPTSIMLIIEDAMILYAQQFIDAADEIIGAASDVLEENYDEDYDSWYEIQKINET